MKFFIFLLVINAYSIVKIGAQLTQTGQSGPFQSFLVISYYDDCDGKDASNYTIIGQLNSMGSNCEELSPGNMKSQLVQCSNNGDKAVNNLQILARSLYPAGAYLQAEALLLATSGPLEGKYLYSKIIYLNLSYLKKCSSVLGYSYVSSKTSTLLISEKLDLNVFVSAVGGYETFRKSCTTICRGRSYLF